MPPDVTGVPAHISSLAPGELAVADVRRATGSSSARRVLMCTAAPGHMTERPTHLCSRQSMRNPVNADPGEAPDPDKAPGAAALAAGTGVLVARSNWHVHALGRGGGGGVRWNVTFGRVQQLSLPALRALVDEVDLPLGHTRECCRVLASRGAWCLRRCLVQQAAPTKPFSEQCCAVDMSCCAFGSVKTRRNSARHLRHPSIAHAPGPTLYQFK